MLASSWVKKSSVSPLLVPVTITVCCDVDSIPLVSMGWKQPMCGYDLLCLGYLSSRTRNCLLDSLCCLWGLCSCPRKAEGLWKTREDNGKSDLLYPHFGETKQVHETQAGNPASLWSCDIKIFILFSLVRDFPFLLSPNVNLKPTLSQGLNWNEVLFRPLPQNPQVKSAE